MQTHTKYTNWRLEILRASLGVILFWFGILKFFPNTDSHAKELAQQTIEKISFGIIGNEYSVYLVAAIECLIGLGLIIKPLFRFVGPLIYIHLLGTALPLILFPQQCWLNPFVPTFQAQYILKNIVLIASVLVLSVIRKGGNLISDPKIAQKATKEEIRDEGTAV